MLLHLNAKCLCFVCTLHMHVQDARSANWLSLSAALPPRLRQLLNAANYNSSKKKPQTRTRSLTHAESPLKPRTLSRSVFNVATDAQTRTRRIHEMQRERERLDLNWHSWHFTVRVTDVSCIQRVPWHFLIRDAWGTKGTFSGKLWSRRGREPWFFSCPGTEECHFWFLQINY